MDTPRIIIVHESDNVAIVVNEGGLPAGARVPAPPSAAMIPGSLVLIEAVPQGHKVALTDIPQGAAVLRYGQRIGTATRPLPRGSWVEESAVAMPTAPDLDELERGLGAASATGLGAPAGLDPKRLARLDADLAAFAAEGLGFEGYRNADGTVGSRNLLGLVASVQCVAGVLQIAAARIEKELLSKYPHVDGVVAVNHGYGCGVAINAPDAYIPIRTLRNLAAHPNFGGEALIVGLGCEKLLPDRIAPPCAGCTGAAEPSTETNIIMLQDEKGFAAMVDSLMRQAEIRLRRLEARRREPCALSDLTVGVQCGGSDAFSGVTANPAIGYAGDLLARAGAAVMFSEVTEVRDGIHLLVPRAADDAVRAALIREMRWYDAYLDRGGADRSANPTPGNKKGGLANIVEKAQGSIAKSGESPISAVLGPGEKMEPGMPRGMIFAATPASDFVCGTQQLASGIVLQVFSTGRGTPYGLAMAPVVKVGSRSYLKKQWPDLIDVDAGRIAEGRAGIEDVGRELFRLMVDSASGRAAVWAERHGIRNDLVVFNPAPVT